MSSDLLQQAITAHQAGALDEAKRLYQAVLQAEPDHADAIALLGLVLDAQGWRNEAIAHVAKAIQIDPNSALFYCHLGSVLMNAQRQDEAIAAFRQAISLMPGMALAHYNLGNVLSGKKDYQAAIFCYIEALRLDPGLAEAHRNMALALQHKGLYDEAVTQAKLAVKVKPEYGEGWMTLGSIVLESDPELAVMAGRESLQLIPRNHLAWIHYASALQKVGRLEDAAHAYGWALRLRPDLDDLRNVLATLYNIIGRSEDATRIKDRKNDPKAEDRPILVVYGNCQAGAISGALTWWVELVALFFDVRYIASHEEINQMQDEDWGRVAVSFEQYTAHAPLKYGPVPENMSRVLFPAGDCLALWPMSFCDPRNHPTAEFKYGPFPYGDKVIIEMAKEPLPADPYAAYIERSTALMPDLDRAQQIDKIRCEQREQNTDVKIVPYIFAPENYGKLFWTTGHPNGKLLREIMRQLFACAKFLPGIEGEMLWGAVEKKTRNWDPLNNQTIPIHPAVISHFNLPYDENTIYRYHGIAMTHREWVLYYLNYNFEAENTSGDEKDDEEDIMNDAQPSQELHEVA